MFSSDKPIKSKSYDQLNRTEFSKQLAQAIVSYTEKDNFTISLCGRWGSGKTSILNMVIEEITNQTKDLPDDKKPIIIFFNPWNYADQTQLTTQFFKTVMSTLGNQKNNEALKNIGEALQNYADVLDYAAYIPVVGEYLKLGKFSFSGAGKAFYKKASQKESLENKKDIVWKALEEQSQKLIIVIDDIDRLTNNQIRLIFQLVNSLAGFPNMIYLLSFDKNVVTRALSEEQKCDGNEYLEKIIQVPFEIPEVNKSLIENVFCEKVADIVFNGKEQNITFEIEYWKKVFPSCISPFVNTMRDVNRIINTYKFKLGLMGEEVNCIDLLVITTLQICAPEIYNWIYGHSSLLTGSSINSTGISIIEQKENASKYIEIFKVIFPSNPSLMLNVIQQIFPRFSWNTGGYGHNHEDDLTLLNKQRISSSQRFNRYFNLSLEDIHIDRKQMLNTIINYDSAELQSYLVELQKINHLSDYLQELRALVGEIPVNRRLLFIEVLTHLRLDENNQKRTGFLVPTVESKAANCIFEIFKQNDKHENFQNLLKWIDNATIYTLPYICEIVEDIERGYARIGKSTNYDYMFIVEDNIQEVEKALLKKIQEFSENTCIFDYSGIENICLLWNFLDKESLHNYKKILVQSDINIPKYLSQISSYWHSSNSKDGWSFSNDSFGDIISAEEAFEKILGIKNTARFSTLDYKFKQIAIAFYFWYQRKNSNDQHITRNEIDAEIPLWEYLDIEEK